MPEPSPRQDAGATDVASIDGVLRAKGPFAMLGA